MAWPNSLLDFAGAAARSFIGEVFRPDSGSTRSATSSRSLPHDFDLQSTVLAYGQAAGLGTPRLHRQTVAFTVLFERVPYMVLFSPGPGCVIASAHSNLSFCGSLPRPIEIAIDNMNRKDDSGCVYDTVDQDGGVSLCSMTRVDLNLFSQRAFNLMVSTLTKRIAVFDRVLESVP